MVSQLADLARPFPARFVHANPSGGGSYVGHEVVTQRLLHAVGPFSTAVVEVIRGDVPGRPGDPNGKSARARAGTPDLSGAVVGVLLALTVEVDGDRGGGLRAAPQLAPRRRPHEGRHVGRHQTRSDARGGRYPSVGAGRVLP